MKYIIELNPDCVDGEFLRIPIRVAGEDQWIKTKASLTPYTETDRKAIEDDVWEFVGKIQKMACWQMHDVLSITAPNYDDFCNEISYQEAKAKYEAWKKQKDEIHVGDELEQITANGSPTGLKCIVVKINGDKMQGIDKDGDGVVCSSQVKRWWTKTGQHFDEVDELLKKMRDTDED